MPSKMIHELVDSDVRTTMFKTAIRFVDYELVPGDIMEFGTYTGRSLALLAHAAAEFRKSIHKTPFERRVVGFDSFKGLAENEHPRWPKGVFKINHSYHPTINKGERVTAQSVIDFFRACELDAPCIEEGFYGQTLPEVIGSKYTQAAVVHIDCDLFDPTTVVLDALHSIFQDGTVLLFDDWYNFKGHPTKGEQGAFRAYIDRQDRWNFIEYQKYATFGNSFVVSSKS